MLVKLWMLFAALGTAGVVMAETRSGAEAPSGGRSHSTVSLAADTRVEGIAFSEISGLAWDAEEQWLYAVSDKGKLFRLRLRIENGELRAVVPVAAVMMKSSAGSLGQRSGFDAEGLALRRSTGDPAQGSHRMELLVATEGTPRVLRVDPSGEVLGELPLMTDLAEAKRYADDNSMLEAVAIHPVLGVLVAPERPLRSEKRPAGHRIQAVDRRWHIQALDPAKSHLKAMDVLDDGQLLVLERSGSGKRLINTLRSVKLETCTGPSPCPMQTLLHIDQAGGAENFEGMAYLGHGQVLLASDNRGKKNTPTVFLLVNPALTESCHNRSRHRGSAAWPGC